MDYLDLSFSEADIASFAQICVHLRQTYGGEPFVVELSLSKRSAQLHFKREGMNGASVFKVIDYTGLKLGDIPPIKSSAELAELANNVAELLLLQR